MYHRRTPARRSPRRAAALVALIYCVEAAVKVFFLAEFVAVALDTRPNQLHKMRFS